MVPLPPPLLENLECWKDWRRRWKVLPPPVPFHHLAREDVTGSRQGCCVTARRALLLGAGRGLSCHSAPAALVVNPSQSVCSALLCSSLDWSQRLGLSPPRPAPLHRAHRVLSAIAALDVLTCVVTRYLPSRSVQLVFQGASRQRGPDPSQARPEPSEPLPTPRSPTRPRTPITSDGLVLLWDDTLDPSADGGDTGKWGHDELTRRGVAPCGVQVVQRQRLVKF